MLRVRYFPPTPKKTTKYEQNFMHCQQEFNSRCEKKTGYKKRTKMKNEDIIKCCNPAHFIHGLRGISCRDMYCFQIIRAVRSTHFCNRTTHCVACKLMFSHLIHVWRGMILYHTLLVNTEAPQMSALRIRIRVCLERNELFWCAPPLPRQKYHIFVLFYLFRVVSFFRSHSYHQWAMIHAIFVVFA